MWNKNTRGPKREPRGTPQFISATPESSPL